MAAASSTSAVVTFAVGYFVARYVEETMRQQPVWRFLGVTGVQGIALLAALLLAQAWPARCGIYLLLSVVPTGWSLMLLRRQRW